MAITAKRRAFIEAYFRCHFNATEAARQAGYKHPNVKGSQLVKVSEIAEEIQRRMAEEVMCPDEVLLRLSDMARANISEFIDKETGAIDWEAVQEKGHVVREIIHEKGRRSRLILYNSQRALETMGKYHGLLVEQHKHSGEIGGDITIRVVYEDYSDDNDSPPEETP